MLTTTLCAALSAGGLAIAMLTAYRRRFLAATRIAAVSLLPVGLAMAGLVTLGRKVGTATAHWAADLVFKPTVWMGFGVLAVAAMLYGITRLISARLPEGGGRAPAAVPGASSPAIPSGRPAAAGRRKSSADSGLSDFADVEEILKRRGI
ncbi:hypothetical protein [Actinacidiphila bryophytorum]|uniref:hypothetical protein n=1 Tax=Actinacidiphila bryophytorum TaxID=1436133 RepID=UPI002176B598|nr:hypothetical protein [Actinacidiphila bryophytorum]UWE09399.1 hypothetical protein NYE86_12125 [Actinacidiphila bryophytorum]